MSVSYTHLDVYKRQVNKDASDRAFGKVDLDYFVQSSIDNAENEEERVNAINELSPNPEITRFKGCLLYTSKTVEEWGKERGMTHIAGPLGFTDFDAEGMLVEGFDQLSTCLLYTSRCV